MGKKLGKWITVFLFVVLMIPTLPMAASTQEAETEDYHDFVLLLDCSRSKENSEIGKQCATACRLFLDMVPLENVRVGVIAYGYEDRATTYTGSREYVEKTKSVSGTAENVYCENLDVSADMADINSLTKGLVQLTQNDKNHLKQDLKSFFDRNGMYKGTHSPFGVAMLAAQDMLRDTEKGHGSIIVISDGDIHSKNSSADPILLKNVRSFAIENEQEIYTILFNGENSDSLTARRNRMEDLATSENGFWELASGNSLNEIFLAIFSRFLDCGEQTHEALGGEGLVMQWQCGELTAEATVAILGNGITDVEIGYDGDSTYFPLLVDKNTNRKNVYTATVENREYFCIKLIAPKAGRYTITVHGDPNAQVTASVCSWHKANLNMTARHKNTSLSVGDNCTASRADVLHVEAGFRYNGIPLSSSQYMDVTDCTVTFENVSNGNTHTYLLHGTQGTDGLFTGDIPLRDLKLPAGSYRLYATVPDQEAFAVGTTRSNAYPLTIENEPMVANSNADKTLAEIPVGHAFEPIDLRTICINPDGDDYQCDLVNSIDGSDMAFSFALEGDNLIIQPLYQSGDYKVTLSVRDAETDEQNAVCCTLNLKVTNEPITGPDRLKKITLHQGAPKGLAKLFSYIPRYSQEIFLNQYYQDPDGLPIQYDFCIKNSDGSKEDLITIDSASKDDTGHFLIRPTQEAGTGKAEVTFRLSDKVPEDDRDVCLEVEITDVTTAFWSEYGFCFILAITIIIIAICILGKRMCSVGGKWVFSFSLEENDRTISTATPDHGISMDKDRHSINVQKIATYMLSHCSDGKVAEKLRPDIHKKWFCGQRSNITMNGHWFRLNGCTLCNIPPDVKVTYNKRIIKKRKNIIWGGTIKIVLPDGKQSTLTIEIRLISIPKRVLNYFKTILKN